MKLVTIKYTQDVKAYSGHVEDVDGNDTAVTIEAGTVRKVDATSAKSLVNDSKVAKIVGDAETKADARAAVKAAPSAGDGK